MDSLRQIITYPSRAAVSALLIYEQKHGEQKHGDAIQSEESGQATPSSAEYAMETIARHGLLVGGSKACWRALRLAIPHIGTHHSRS